MREKSLRFFGKAGRFFNALGRKEKAVSLIADSVVLVDELKKPEETPAEVAKAEKAPADEAREEAKA